MSRRKAVLVFGVWGFLLLTSMLTLAFNVQPVNAWTGTVYIRADGSIEPPDAPIITYDNVTYTLTDNITSSERGIIVERDNIIIDGAGYTIQGIGNGTGVDLSDRNNVTLKRIKVQSFEKGVYLKGSAYCTLTDNTVTYNLDGVTVESIGEVVIEKNEISHNSESGVLIVGKSNLLIKENTIKWNKNGIATDNARSHSGIIISNNTILSNQENGIYIYSYEAFSFRSSYAYIFNITVLNNVLSFNGGTALYLRSRGGSGSFGSGSGSSYIYNINVSHNTFLSNGWFGMWLTSWGYGYGNGYGYVFNISVSSNIFSSNVWFGIGISSNGDSSGGYDGYGYIHDVTFLNNTIEFNGRDGIGLYSDGEGIEVTFWGPYGDGYSYIHNVTLSNNEISFNGRNGIGLYSSSRAPYGGRSYIFDANFSNNIIISNGENGINLNSKGWGGYSAYGKGYIYNVVMSSNKILLNNENGINLNSEGKNNAGYIYNTSAINNTISSNGANGFYARAHKHYSKLIYDLKLYGNTISANNQKGIWINGEIKANLTYNSISYNSYGVFYTRTTSNLAHNNDIYRNSKGMNVTEGATVNATYNYWGDSSGPYHETLNPEGKGNSVNGDGVNLGFIPFLTDPVGQINERPVAVLVADKTTVETNQIVTFNASGSIDDGRIEYYFFNFGDGANSGWTTSPVTTHNYTSAGVYNATLIITDDLGVTSLDGNFTFVTITVLAPPIANFSYTPQYPLIDETIIFDASDSYDPDGIIKTYMWNFGDGNVTTLTTPTITHVYAIQGTYTVNLTVTDNDDLSHSTTKSITVTKDSTPPTTTHDYDDLWHTTDFTINLVATDDLSGVAETYYKINNGPTKTVSADGQPLITTEGANNTLEYWSVDNADNEEVPHNFLTGIKLDKTTPTGSIVINNDDAYTTSTSVTLTLTATDATSGVYQVRYSNDGVWDTEPWENFAPTKTWTLTPGDGTKTVHYQIKDNAGLISDKSDTIILDTTPPAGSITINDNATYTTTATVTLTLSATDQTSGTAEMRFSNDNVSWTNWEPYATSKSWTLQDGDGVKTVYVQFRDQARLISTYSDVIILDTNPPTGSIIINDGSAYTNSTSVTLTLTADDETSGVAQMRFSNNGTDWSSGEPYATSKAWTLPSNDGTRTVYVQFMDNAGLTSKYQDTIILDTTPPVADAGQDQTVAEDTLVSFDASASTDENGIASYTWAFTDITPQTLTGINPTYNFTTPGTYTVTLKVTDPAGNTNTDTVTITVLLDTDGDGTPDITDQDDDNDGMPDSWETENGLDPLNAEDASLDPDGDGLTNLQEYQQGTDPNISDVEAIPIWTIAAATAIIAIATAIAATILWKKRK